MGLEELASSVTGVIAMTGYSTVTELLKSSARLMPVLRNRPRLAQVIRAERLGPVTGFELVEADVCVPSQMASFVTRSLAATGPRQSSLPLRLDGQIHAGTQIRHLLSKRRSLHGQLV